jgi:rhodanese-related sulfurtransferase
MNTEDFMATTAMQMVLDAKAQVENISPKDAFEEFKAGKATLLDVREPVEWESHIEGAVQVPRGLLEFAADPASPRHKVELDPAGRVIVFCRSGARSALAAATLKALGYGNVANLDGGFTAWKEAGLPVSDHHVGL